MESGMNQLTCFKAYDIRGKLGEELNEDIAYRIGRAYAQYLTPKTVVIGGDVRESSESLKAAVARGLMDEGCNVIDIGMTGTEEVYYATQFMCTCGGIEITASHNPIDYNGMKLVRHSAKPISGDTGLFEIKRLAELNQFGHTKTKGTLTYTSNLGKYTEHLLSYINSKNIPPLKLVVNAGNGAAGHVIDALENQFAQSRIPVTFIKIHHQPDSTFPNGIPNPLLPECRAATSQAVIDHKADMGIAWDGDFDRCFLFDENGQFIEGYYIVGLLADAFLEKEPNSKIVHDPRLIWNTIDIVVKRGGESVMSKTGHAFFKERMRKEDAVYGGEMSAHHYFRDFAYCDSGMIPWLLVIELIGLKKQSLSSMVEKRVSAYPSSGEINVKLADPQKTIDRIYHCYLDASTHVDRTDGLSMEFADWRFNLRSSNTEPVVRLNVESRANLELMNKQTAELLALLRS